MGESVSALLQRSRAAHVQFHAADALHVGNGQWAKGNQAEARAFLQQAADLRERAAVLDPAFSDPAWAEDKAPHAHIATFYRDYLAKTAA